jgi:hypothetical protein
LPPDTPGTPSRADPAPNRPRRRDTEPRPVSAYHRYRQLQHVFDHKLRVQVEKMRIAQANLDATLAKDEQQLIESGRRLLEHGHLSEEPPRRPVD